MKHLALIFSFSAARIIVLVEAAPGKKSNNKTEHAIHSLAASKY